MKKLFTCDKFFLITVLLSVFGAIGLILMQFTGNREFLAYNLTLLVFPICTMILYLSYRHHDKNVMKAVMGALLMALIMSDFAYLSLGDKVTPFFLFFDCLLFFSHLLINSDRHASPGRIRFNQIVVLGYLAIELGWTVIGFSGSETAFDVLFTVFSVLTYLATAFVIVCVESRLDAYRLDREAAGWTEETGYPEGYVRQKDR